MSTVNTSAIRDLLLPGLDTILGDYPDMPAQWKDLFDQHTSDKDREIDVEVKLLGLARIRAEGAATEYEGMGQRYVTTYRHIGVALGFAMTKYAIRDNLYKSQFGPNTRALKRSFSQTKEVFGAAIINNATDAAFPLGDGQPFFSTAHPIDVGTYANTPTAPAELNETSLQDAVVMAQRMRDAAGLRVMIKPRKLIVATELQFVAERLLKTERRVGTADNDVSALYSLSAVPEGYRVNHFFTNTRTWVLKTDAPDAMKHYQRDPFEKNMRVDPDTGNLLVSGEERYSFGVSNARGAVGCLP